MPDQTSLRVDHDGAAVQGAAGSFHQAEDDEDAHPDRDVGHERHRRSAQLDGCGAVPEVLVPARVGSAADG